MESKTCSKCKIRKLSQSLMETEREKTGMNTVAEICNTSGRFQWEEKSGGHPKKTNNLIKLLEEKKKHQPQVEIEFRK